jgi:cell wall-associated NlpC family hydrolase
VKFSRLAIGVALPFLLFGLCDGDIDAGCYDEKSLTYDFGERDRLPEFQESRKQSQKWGPRAISYPTVRVSAGCDPVTWKRLRVVAVAKRYIGLPYRHRHAPGWESDTGNGPGLDCSNFTAWVYNYGLGIRFTSDVHKQSDGPLAPGRRLRAGESFEPGDLLFIMKKDGSKVSHVVIYIDEHHIIDSHGPGVKIRPFKDWYKSHYSHARRIIE